MATTNRCQRLKDILEGKTINRRRPKSESDNSGKLEQELPTTVQQLKENIPNKKLNEAKVHRLREILQKDNSACKGHEVSYLTQKHATQVESPAVASREPQGNCDAEQKADPLQSRSNIPDTHTMNYNEPEKKKTLHSSTAERLRRILGKRNTSGTSQVCKSYDAEAATDKVASEDVDSASRDNNRGTSGDSKSCNVGSSTKEVLYKKMDPISCCEEAIRLEKQEPVSKSRVSFEETIQVIPISESSTPEPQDGTRQKQCKIAKRRLPQNTRTDVVVVGIRSNLVYVQEISLLRELVNTMQALQSAIANEPQMTEVPELKTYVAALRSEDRTWYRACVEGERGGGVEVFYIDYGNKGTVGIEDLKSLPAPFLEVPAFAISVRPQGVDEVNAGIVAFLQGQVFVAEVMECIGKQRVVKLYEKESGQCINEVLKELIEISKENLE